MVVWCVVCCTYVRVWLCGSRGVVCKQMNVCGCANFAKVPVKTSTNPDDNLKL